MRRYEDDLLKYKNDPSEKIAKIRNEQLQQQGKNDQQDRGGQEFDQRDQNGSFRP
jgi:hypothetical protein